MLQQAQLERGATGVDAALNELMGTQPAPDTVLDLTVRLNASEMVSGGYEWSLRPCRRMAAMGRR